MQVDTLTGMFVDMSISGEYSVTLTVKTDHDCQLRIDLKDANGRTANGKATSAYQNTQRLSLKAADGWKTFTVTWDKDMLDFYSGDYWGNANGMYNGIGEVVNGVKDNSNGFGAEGTYLWAWTDDTHTSVIKTEIAQETNIPVTPNAIASIIFIIDAEAQGTVNVPVNVQIKDLTIGDVASAVDFIPVFTDMSVSDKIIYNPKAAVLLRAREEMVWPASQFLGGATNPTVKSPYAVSTIKNLELQSGFSVQSIDLTKYFASNYGTLTYDFEATNIAGSASAFEIKQSINTLNIIEGTGTGAQKVVVYALDEVNNTSVSQTFIVSYGGNASNSAPYIIAPLQDFDLVTGFKTQPQIVLADIFADDDSQLTYFVDVYSLTGGKSSIKATIVNGYVEITEAGLGTSLLRITATDGFKSVRTLTEISVMMDGNTKPQVTDKTVTVALDVNSNSEINLMDYVSDKDNNALTFSESSSSLKSSSINGNILSVNTATAGMHSYTIVADDGKGGQTSFTVLAFVKSASNTAPVATTIPAISSTKDAVQTIVLSDKFSDASSLTYAVQAADPNIAQLEVVNGTLKVTPIGIGCTEVTVVAYDAEGGFTTQTFKVAITNVGTACKITGATVAVYPTDVTDYVFITNATGKAATVCSLAGTVVASQMVTNDEFTFNMGSIKPGIYFLSVGNEVFKLIKN